MSIGSKWFGCQQINVFSKYTIYLSTYIFISLSTQQQTEQRFLIPFHFIGSKSDISHVYWTRIEKSDFFRQFNWGETPDMLNNINTIFRNDQVITASVSSSSSYNIYIYNLLWIATFWSLTNDFKSNAITHKNYQQISDQNSSFAVCHHDYFSYTILPMTENTYT